MKAVIWGYGKNGKLLGEIFEKYFIQDEIIAYVDNDRNKLNKYNVVPVINPGAISLLLKYQLIDYIIVPGYEPAILREIMCQLYKLEIEYQELLFYADPAYFEEKINDGIYTFKEVLKDCENEIPLVGALEYEISEKCNLNCKRCNHFSNIFQDGEMISLEEYKRDLKNIRSVVRKIFRFKILGGEPLLHPQLDKIVEISRQELGDDYIAVVTNGILVSQLCSKTIEAIKKNKIVLEISVYPPLKEHFPKIEQFLVNNDIQYKVFRQGDLFGAFFDLKGETDPMYGMFSCYGQVCHALKRGMIYKCATGENIHVYNQKYNIQLPEIGIPLEREGKVIKADILKRYLMNTVPLCRYCTDFEYFPWEQTKDDDRKEDWVVGAKQSGR